MNFNKPEGTLIKDPKCRELAATREGLAFAMEKQIVLEAPAVLCDHAFGLHVALGGRVRGIIPREEAQYLPDGEEIKDIAILTRVGKPVSFLVTGFGEDAAGPVAFLSRRRAQKLCVEEYIKTLIPGDVIPAKITHLEPFGAFVDIGCGIISLLSIDAISVSRISHPSARHAVGDEIYVAVRAIDERGRIYVSERELFGSWEENAGRFAEGQTVRGVIRSIENYGVFVELMPNLAGLAEFRDDVHVGQSAAVYIKSILPDKMKIKLIVIDAGDEETSRGKPEYFVDTEKVKHIDRWLYSPASCPRVIETVF